jgi:glycosyltransferase involved in cell wall biosynthesis
MEMSSRRLARVVHVGPDRTRGGGMAAVMRDMLCSPLAERYTLDLIVTYRGREPVGRTLLFLRSLVQLARWCRGDGRRLVHVHTAIRGSVYRKALAVAVASAAGRPVLLQVHAGAGDIDAFAARLTPWRRRLLGAGVRRADIVVSVSSAGARRFGELFGVDDVRVVPNAAPPLPAVAAAPAAAANGRPPRALYIGGFRNPAKGGAVLIEAVPALLAASPHVEVVFAGSGEPPPGLAALCESEPRVSWHGWVDGDAKHDLLSTCDVFVMPSLSEGLPVALLEAMSYGRPVVATDVGGIPDVVADGREALLVPAADPQALSDGVSRLLADAEARDRLGEAARERVRAFDRDEVYGRIASLYDDLLAANPSP